MTAAVKKNPWGIIKNVAARQAAEDALKTAKANSGYDALYQAYAAADPMGISLPARILHAVFPQLVPQITSGTLYRFDVNIREASVLGLAGAGGIGAPLIFAMNQYAWNEVSTLALGMIFLAWLVDLVSSNCRKIS